VSLFFSLRSEWILSPQTVVVQESNFFSTRLLILPQSERRVDQCDVFDWTWISNSGSRSYASDFTAASHPCLIMIPHVHGWEIRTVMTALMSIRAPVRVQRPPSTIFPLIHSVSSRAGSFGSLRECSLCIWTDPSSNSVVFNSAMFPNNSHTRFRDSFAVTRDPVRLAKCPS
jgi:hypothetical protein